MDDLTLIGFCSHELDDGFREIYSTEDGYLYMYKRGRWFDDDAGMEHEISALNHARKNFLLQQYHQWLSARPFPATGLESYVLPELAGVISQYLAVLEPYPMPLPPENLHEVFRHVINLDGLHPCGDVFPNLLTTDEHITERWQTDDGSGYVYFGMEPSYGSGMWDRVLGDNQSEGCSLFHDLLLSTRRSQIAGIPLR